MRTSAVNGLALALALGLASGGALLRPETSELSKPRIDGVEVSARGAKIVKDARRREIEARAYQRIVSLDPEASRLLLSLIAPQRLIAVSSYARDKHPLGYRFGKVQTIEKSSQIEAIVALEPDLVIISPLSDAASVARLRELGIAVFDLGGARDLETSLKQLHLLGQLLLEPERALRAQAQLQSQIRGLEARLGARSKIPGIYLTRYADKFYGGTKGTSYSDLLRLAGISDIAAQQGYTQWPSYSIEELWRLDPEVIVTRQGQGATLCRHPQLGKLRACNSQGRVMEALAGLESDSGQGLLSAASDLLERLHFRP